jgi:uncharacterized pyridoxamine 5'-phosphate oxidase family protein
MSLEEVLGHLQFLNRIVLATVEHDQPRLRPVTLIFHDERFFVTTGTNEKKIKQITHNPKVEFLLLLPDEQGNTGYIRCKCTASIVDDKKIKTSLYERVPHVSALWKDPLDENLTVFELFPIEYDYMKPGDFHSKIIKASS